MSARMEDPSCLEALKVLSVMAATIYSSSRDLTMPAAVEESSELFGLVRSHVEERHKQGGKYARHGKPATRRAAYGRDGNK